MTGPHALPASVCTEAARWHALHRERALTSEEHSRFFQWLTDSPEHLREYLAVGQLASELGQAMAGMDIDVDALLAAPVAPANVVALPLPRRTALAPAQRKPQRLRRFAAIAASLALVAGSAGWLCWPRTYRYATAHAEQRSITLPDHSYVQLNAQSRLVARFSLLRREVTLLQGQATFQVAHERRPFQVRAADLTVRDIGTTFDVALQREQLRIGVAEGRVQVSGQDASAPPLADLASGQSARIGYRDGKVSISREDTGMMSAWQHRRIVAHDDSLSDVADQFNRLNRIQVVVTDPQAGALRLTGNLRGDDVESLRAFLALQPGLQTTATANEIRVGSRR